MTEITLVTGNSNKLTELRSIFPATVNLTSRGLDLPEIQSMDPHEIVSDKLQSAYNELHRPVIVEDVSAELAALNGLPGPFIKFVEQSLGRGALYELCKGHKDKRALIRCTMGYFDGDKQTIVDGSVRGTIVEPRGENGFGFDFVFVPEGEVRTNAEMSPEEKNQKSHRYLAASALLEQLSADGNL